MGHALCQHLKVLVTHSCSTLCDPVDCSLPGSSVQGIFQGIFPAQESNSGLLHFEWTLYLLSHQGNPVPVLTMW